LLIASHVDGLRARGFGDRASARTPGANDTTIPTLATSGSISTSAITLPPEAASARNRVRIEPQAAVGIGKLIVEVLDVAPPDDGAQVAAVVATRA